MGLFDPLFPKPQYPNPPEEASGLPAPDAVTETVVGVAFNPAITPSLKKSATAVVATAGAPLTFTVPVNAGRVRLTLGPTEIPEGADPVAAWCGAVKRSPGRGAEVKVGDVLTVTPVWLAPDGVSVPPDTLACEVRAVFEAAAK